MSKQMFFVDENGNPYPEVKSKSLGAIAERVTRKNKNNFSERNLTISGELGLIDQLDYFTKNVSSKDNSGYYLLEKGEFAYNKSYSKHSPAGATKKLHRYDFGAVSPLYICFKITSHEEVYAEYLEHFFETPIWGKELMSVAVEGARNHGLLNVSVPDFFTLRVPLPALPEQQKIAEFFSALDERIALTADKVKVLKEQKTGYLQQVFAQELVFTDDNGGKYPEWENVSISELFEGKNSSLVSSTLSKSKEDGNIYTVYGASGVAGYSKNFQQEKPYISVIKDGAGVGRLAFCKAKTSIVGTMTALLPKNNCHLEFGFYLLQTQKLTSDVSGSTIPHIYFKDYSQKKVIIPSLPEQEKIAEFFSALDERIELTENKLTLLKEQKKGYLQGIFG